MNFLDVVNLVLRDTGVHPGVNTLAGVDPDTDVGRVIDAVRSAGRDISRKIPQSALKRTGSINTVAKITLSALFADMDGDGAADNALTVVGSKVGGASDNQLPVQESWIGRLFWLSNYRHAYRVRAVDLAAKTFTLADPSGAEVAWVEDTPSLKDDGTALAFADAWGVDYTYPIGYIAQDRYMLPSGFKLPDQLSSFWGPGSIALVSASEFDQMRFGGGNPMLCGTPEISCIREVVAVDGKLRYYVEVYPIPERVLMLPFRYEASMVTLEKDTDPLLLGEELLQALLSRARWYVYRFVKKSLEDAQMEEGTWRDVLTDTKRNPVSAVEQPQFAPQTNRDFWESAYDG